MESYRRARTLSLPWQTLSIDAGVVGLLTAAVQVSQILNDMIKKARHAPDDCSRMKAEVDDIRNVLGTLQLFILNVNRASRSRTSLLMVEQVVATLASCVLTFSDLQLFVESLQSEVNLDILDRVRWISKTAELKAMQNRLETHQSSVSLMLTILTCQLQIEAESKVDRVCLLIEDKILGENLVLAERLTAYDTFQDLGLEQTQPEDATDSIELSDFAQGTGIKRDVRGFAFEELLMNSRLSESSQENVRSFSCCKLCRQDGAMLSGLSLWSNIAILLYPYIPRTAATKKIMTLIHRKKSHLCRNAQHLHQQEAKVRADWGKQVALPTVSTSEIHRLRAASGYEFKLAKSLVVSQTTKEKASSAIPSGSQVSSPSKAKRKIMQPSSERMATPSNAAFAGDFRYPSRLELDTRTMPVLLLRFLKSLPEPVVPYSHYSRFTRSFQDLGWETRGELTIEEHKE